MLKNRLLNLENFVLNWGAQTFYYKQAPKIMNRKPLTLYFALVCACAMLVSCKKDKSPDPNPMPNGEVRLTGIEMKSGGNSYRYTLQYDNLGRIATVSHASNDEPGSILFNVTYEANDIILTRPMYEDPSVQILDTIRFSLDLDGNVRSRLQYRYVKSIAPNGDESRTYIHDTTVCEYNVEGLLTNLMHNLEDSTWTFAISGSESKKVLRKMELADYIIEGSKLSFVNRRGDVSEITYVAADTSILNTIEEAVIEFDYAKAYQNKIDFSNAAVLNELHAFTDLPLNKKFAYLPNTVHTTKTRKNMDGVIFSTTSVSTQSDFTFNADGYVVSKGDPGNPGTTVQYSYSK